MERRRRRGWKRDVGGESYHTRLLLVLLSSLLLLLVFLSSLLLFVFSGPFFVPDDRVTRLSTRRIFCERHLVNANMS